MKTEGYILIAENFKTEKYREYHRSYNDDVPVSFIKSFSKITLQPDEEFAHFSTSKTYIIPLTGGIELDENNVLVSGEYRILNKSVKTIKNASPDFETVFILIELNLLQSGSSEVHPILVNPLSLEKSLEPSFGLYSYREDQVIEFKNVPDCFIHVIAGNFEMEERFVNQGDSLILENTNTLEFECLSEQGLFLLLKI
jgi:hypothetical protein